MTALYLKESLLLAAEINVLYSLTYSTSPAIKGYVLCTVPGNILAVLLWYIFTVLLGHLLANFLGLAVALG